MTPAETKAMLGAVLAAWPTPSLPAETEQAWLALLLPQRFELVDFQKALFKTNEQPQAFRPHISEFISAAIANWHLRLQGDDARALGQGDADFGKYLDEHPKDRARLVALAEHATHPAPPMTREETVTLGQLKPPKASPISLGMCSGVGQPTKLVQRVWVCPACGSPVEEGCRPSSARRGKAVSI